VTSIDVQCLDWGVNGDRNGLQRRRWEESGGSTTTQALAEEWRWCGREENKTAHEEERESLCEREQVG
jgi:hypothetical protein